MKRENTLRARKKAQTRESLIEVARRLFLAQGYDATTIDQIAETAEISRRTFFRYFPTKEAVLFPRDEERFTKFCEVLVAGSATQSAIVRVKNACLQIAQEYSVRSEELHEQRQIINTSPTLLAHEQTLDRRWERAIADELSKGQSPEKARRGRILAGTIMGAIRATLEEWLATGATADLVVLGEETFSWLEQGIRGFTTDSTSYPERSNRKKIPRKGRSKR